MDRIITSYVVDPSIQQPITSKSMKFLQDSIQNSLTSLVATITPDLYLGGTPIMLFGGQKSLVAGTTYIYQDGFVFYNGEIFVIPSATVTIAPGNVDLINFIITNDPIADPITFSDAVSRNVHNVRRLSFGQGPTGSGLFDYSIMFYLQDKTRDFVCLNTPAYGSVLPGHRAEIKYTSAITNVAGWYNTANGQFLMPKGWYEVNANISLYSAVSTPILGSLTIEQTTGIVVTPICTLGYGNLHNGDQTTVGGSFIFYADGVSHYNVIQHLLDQDTTTMLDGTFTIKKLSI